MKNREPQEVHEMRETLRMFKAAAKTVSGVQGKLRESFSPPPSPEVMERVLVTVPKST